MNDHESQFDALLRDEEEWPRGVSTNVDRDLYSKFYDTTHELANNIVYGYYGIIDHDMEDFGRVSADDPMLSPLSIDIDIHVPFDFSSSIPIIDTQRIMIDRDGINHDHSISLCESCYKTLKRGSMPAEALANYR